MVCAALFGRESRKGAHRAPRARPARPWYRARPARPSARVLGRTMVRCTTPGSRASIAPCSARTSGKRQAGRTGARRLGGGRRSHRMPAGPALSRRVPHKINVDSRPIAFFGPLPAERTPARIAHPARVPRDQARASWAGPWCGARRPAPAPASRHAARERAANGRRDERVRGAWAAVAGPTECRLVPLYPAKSRIKLMSIPVPPRSSARFWRSERLHESRDPGTARVPRDPGTARVPRDPGRDRGEKFGLAVCRTFDLTKS